MSTAATASLEHAQRNLLTVLPAEKLVTGDTSATKSIGYVRPGPVAKAQGVDAVEGVLQTTLPPVKLEEKDMGSSGGPTGGQIITFLGGVVVVGAVVGVGAAALLDASLLAGGVLGFLGAVVTLGGLFLYGYLKR